MQPISLCFLWQSEPLLPFVSDILYFGQYLEAFTFFGAGPMVKKESGLSKFRLFPAVPS